MGPDVRMRPSIGFIHEITGRCNLACAFCYNPWPASCVPEELSVEENSAMLERVLTDSQASWLTFTGGEPLLYDGLERVMAFVHQRFPGLRLGLATNGVLLEASRLDRLMAAGLGYVEVSLFASEAETYRSLAGREPSRQNNLDAQAPHRHKGPQQNQLNGTADFDAAPKHHGRPMHALALARSRGLPTTAATVLRSGMENELEDLIRIAYALGTDRLALNRFVARGRGLNHQASLMPSLQELDRLLTLADRLGSELAYPIAITTPIEACLLPHKRFPHLDFGPCVCGELKWAIDPQGNLRTCELSDWILGSLMHRPFKELAECQLASDFRHRDRFPACSLCPSEPHCGGGCRFL